MPKTKSHSASKKRYRVSASGKVKYNRPGKRHNLGHRKSAAKKLAKRKGVYVHPTNVAAIRENLPYRF